MDWTLDNEPFTVTPPDAHGFIYLITYTDGTMYVGKKDFYSNTTLPALQSGVQRPNSTRVGKNRNGKRVYFDVVRKESNWKKYEGSSKNTKGKTVQSKEILAIANSKRALTYLEVKFLFQFSVLESDEFINDNILGKFFDNCLE